MKKQAIILVCIQSIILFISCSKNQAEKIGVNLETKEAVLNLSSRGNTSFASGQASLFLSHLNGRVQHFSFHVIKDANGNVKGTWESKSPGQDLRTHGTLNCLMFLDDHTAYMTGVVTQKVGTVFPDGEYEVGMPVWFKVRDNGEGSNGVADEFTDYYSLQGIECVHYEQASIHPIVSGNIQVRR